MSRVDKCIQFGESMKTSIYGTQKYNILIFLKRQVQSLMINSYCYSTEADTDINLDYLPL